VNPIVLALLYPNGVVSRRNVQDLSTQLEEMEYEGAVENDIIDRESTRDGAGTNFIEGAGRGTKR